METRTGAVIAGRYHLGRQLGRGGMAVVHVAEDERLDREVAVKLLDRAVYPDDQEGHERFSREARRAAGLNHPNIVQVHDTGVDSSRPYIVMELVDGPTLADRIDERAPLPPDEAARIAATMCEALAAAHEAGVIHRDIKPGNVLFGAKGRLKLADFGLAKAHAAGDTLTEGNPMGSAAYVAPEQISDTPVDHRADLFSLGVVLYEMLTGRRPFKGDTPAATAVQRLAETPPPPSQFVELPERLEQVALRLLSRDPDERYASAGDVVEALRGAVTDTATLPLVAAGAGDTAPRRTRWVLAALAVLLAGAVGMTLWPRGDTQAAVATPDVSEMTVEAATRVLEDAGLVVGEIREEDAQLAAGLVLSQAPQLGVPVDAGSAVDLVVSAEGDPDAGSVETSPGPSPAPTEDGGTPSGGSESGGDAGTDGPDTPGHGGTPPGQGGDPPGRGNS